MTYNANIPQPTNLISNSQPQLLANFGQLNTQFAVDHTAFNTGSGNGDGYHKKVTMALQGSNPTAIADDIILYNKQVTYTGAVTRNELFMEQCTGDGSGVIQLTDLFKSINTTSTGSTFLPGGLVIKWGQFTGTTGTSFTSNFASAFNTTAQVVVACAFNASAAAGTWYVSSWNSTSLTITATASITSPAFTYIAIGT